MSQSRVPSSSGRVSSGRVPSSDPTNSDGSSKFASRPNIGTAGRIIPIFANYFPMAFDPKVIVHHYYVEIEPFYVSNNGGDDLSNEIGDLSIAAVAAPKRFRKLDMKINRLIMNEMIVQNSHSANQLFHRQMPVYDGQRNVYTSKRLENDQFRIPVNFNNDGRDDKYMISFKFVKSIDMSLLQMYFNGDTSEVPNQCLQVINIILRHGPSMYDVPIGASLYKTRANGAQRKDIGGARQLAYGIFLSVRAAISRVNLVIDRTCTAFYCDGYLPKIIADILGLNKEKFMAIKEFTDSQRRRIVNELKGREIRVRHLTYKRRYKVIGVTKQPACGVTFEMKKTDIRGKEISYGKTNVITFYKETYGTDLKMAHLPCIEVGSMKCPSYLPIEVCEVIPDQHVRNNLTADQTAEMIKASASQLPRQRLQLIAQAQADLYEDSRPFMNEFGIEFSTVKKPLNIQARVLESPILKYGRDADLKPFDGKWDMKRNAFLTPMQLDNWIMVVLADDVGNHQLDHLERQFMSIGAQMGMVVKPPKRKARVRNVTNETISNIFGKAIQECGELQLILFVIGNSKNEYEFIKYNGDIKFKIVTQCIKKTSLNRINSAFVTNVMLKMNTKIGGINTMLKNVPEKPDILKKPLTMVMGIDYSHPGPGDRSSSSVSAAVASYDSEHVKYVSSVYVQSRGKTEMILNVGPMISDLLKTYAINNQKKLPLRLVIFRDGVSEGQFEEVVRKELSAIMDECDKLSKGYAPKITFIIVQKRHHTRFFPVNEYDGTGKAKNVPPGLVVDTDIVSPHEFDFYLCSHEGIQGTSRPTHYYVLRNDSGMTADDVQKLTYYLTYIYVRCTRSISAPAPVAYAHLAAYRAQRHIIAQSVDNESDSESGSRSGPVPRNHHATSNVQQLNESIQIDNNYRCQMYFC